MTTFVAGLRPFVGLSSVSRGYSFAANEWRPLLLERLFSLFAVPVTFESYKKSIDQLRGAARDALQDDELTDTAKQQLLATLRAAHDLLVSRPLSVPEPDVEVRPDGRVAFEWYFGPGKLVTATIDGHRRLVFSAIIGQARRGEVVWGDNEWPTGLVSAIEEIRK